MEGWRRGGRLVEGEGEAGEDRGRRTAKFQLVPFRRLRITQAYFNNRITSDLHIVYIYNIYSSFLINFISLR